MWRPLETGSDAGSEYVFEIAHDVNWLNAVPASRKAAFSQIRLREFFPGLLADAELSNDRFIALGIVSFEVVQ